MKTARFIYNGKKADVVFEGSDCVAPVIVNATTCEVGVFAGDLQTTTPALISCQKSILCRDGVPDDPTPDVYAQLMQEIEKLKKSGGVDEEAVNKAVEEYLKEHPAGVPSGGKAGQYLRKVSDADGDVEWADFEIPKEYGLVTYDQDKTITIT